MWDPNQQKFHVGTHTLTIDVENIYFLIGLFWIGSLVVLIGPRGGEMFVDDLIDKYCVVGTIS